MHLSTLVKTARRIIRANFVRPRNSLWMSDLRSFSQNYPPESLIHLVLPSFVLEATQQPNMSSFTFSDLNPYLDAVRDSLPPQVQVYFTRQNLQLLLRVIIIIASYTLFRPYLESLFRKVTGTPDQREEEIKARMEFLKQQREGGGAVPPRSVGVVGKDGKVYKVPKTKKAEEPVAQGSNKKQGKAKGGRKKA